ncbi:MULTISPECIES: response regulator transcription factor [unclassified Alishewanella]|uniref:CtrA n=3 Tax=Alteromonadaceae TaxID=72275 RepID=H3ZDN1_9ALTE|nr:MULTISPECIES: response regulator transcription factor [unclassified Alishewanella]EHR41405.1 CtrA [Alishewanella jeotgali KCTC 22429]EJI86832.1 CtrA [Alishewanella aestuarii B11]MCT8127341.1 response regulator transcription factor [Alishewanella sp. BS5-314]OCW96517.1 DNA-binding response regulator [Alishewanella sp. HH-ZS]
MKILIVEDDDKVAAFLARGLKAEGYLTQVITNGRDVLEAVRQFEPDIIVLDRMLPQVDGLTLCQQLRSQQVNARILMLSALSEVEERVKGLRCGADDYLGKPFHFEELLARIESLAKRGLSPVQSRQLQVADLLLDLDTMRVQRAGRDLLLTAKELAILELLMANSGKVYSRERILTNVWGLNEDPLTNIVDVYMARLRKKVDEHHPQKLLHTRRGLGYCLQAE